jgi:nitric oxide reductase subunit B
VSLVVAWIFLSAIGGIYYYLPTAGRRLRQVARLQNVHFTLCVITGACIIAAYVLGIFGGREYWEYPPLFSAFIAITWIIFAVNFFLTIQGLGGNQPVYVWMWATGIIFFAITFAEAHLWLIPAVRNDPIRDVTVQWKAYGALFGSWNMLVYGTALYLMQRISGNEDMARSKSAFLLYALGFVNLLFGWAHHIYVVPVSPWITGIAYVVSMSEWILFFRIIWNWRSTVSTARQHMWLFPYRFLLAADAWVFLNIFLALLISIPALNVYTHGTHVTVGHAMGSTIGINTMILLASCYFIAYDTGAVRQKPGRTELWGWVLLNVSLFFFWLLLVIAGIRKGTLVAAGVGFDQIMSAITPFLTAFAFTGICVFVGLCLVALPLASRLIQRLGESSQSASPVPAQASRAS